MEGRAVPATFTVTNLNDNLNAGSLRKAITDANASADASSTITFQNGLSGAINLGSELPELTKDITIDGPASRAIALRGSGTSTTKYRCFTTAASTTCELNNLTIFDFYGDGGFGAILNRGVLSLHNDVFFDNASVFDGGAICNSSTGTLTLTACDLHSNHAERHGGAIDNSGVLFICCSTRIYSNHAGNNGGGINNTGDLARASVADDSWIYSNSAGGNGGGVYTNYSFEMTGGRISGNTAGNGGGVYMRTGAATFDGVQLTGNTAQVGGGFYLFGGTFTLRNGVLSGNSATTQANTSGGAWWEDNGDNDIHVGGTSTITDPINQDNTV